MLQEMLTLMPEYAGTAAMIIALCSAVAGLGLWLAGARFSRHLVSLILTAVGAGVGLELPKWVGWNMNGGGTAVAGAVILGVIGFLMHRFWIGLLLGIAMSFWAALTSWALLHKDQPLIWPQIKSETSVASYCTELWHSLPADVTRILPFAVGAALVTGICFALLWPRVATVLNWSLIGVTLLLGMGIEAIKIARPEWMSIIPAQTWAQLTSFFGLIGFGAIVQWKLAPKGSAKRASKTSPEAPAQ